MSDWLLVQWTSITSIDWLILALAVALVGIDTIRNGSRRGTALALAFPIAVLLYSHIGSAWSIGTLTSTLGTTGQAAVFLALVLILYLSFTRFTDSYDGGSILHAVLVGITVATIVSVSWLSVPALTDTWGFSPPIIALFDELYRFWWLLGSLGLLAILRK